MERFKGILFTLKKRVENISENDNDYYKYLVMGYYDGLDINTVDKWYKMRPRGLRELNLQVDLSLPFVDQYTMRAFFPGNQKELETCGFAYEIWDKIGTADLESFEKNVISERSANPYICMSILNVADPSLLGDDLSIVPENLKNCLLESAQNAQILLSELHCAVFPSVGYSDYIVLFLTNDLNKVSRILGGLRKQNGMILISGIYSVCGIDSVGAKCLDILECPEVQIALYINLREGISIGNFIHGLEYEIAQSMRQPEEYRNELKQLREELEENVYITFGYSDSMLVLYKPMSTYKRLYGENHILNPGHPFYKTYIGNLRTTVRMKEKLEKLEIVSGTSLEKETENISCKYADFINKYAHFLESNDFPIRTSIGLKQIIKNYLNITSLTRSFDVSAILGTAFESFITAAEYYINKPLELPESIREDKIISAKYIDIIKNEYVQTVEAVNIYKERIGDFLADLIRSDCAFIEGNTLSHPAIGSATKLLFAYTGILNELARKYGESDRLQFIVISGGCDKTESEDLFSFTAPEEIDRIKKLIIISIPEMSLYDVQGTLFRILHESMHFIGDRKRKERYGYIVNALSSYIAHDITNIRFSNNSLEKYIICAVNGGDQSIEIEINEKFLEEFKKVRDYVQKEIQGIIYREVFQEYMHHSDDSCYHKGVIFQRVLTFDSLADKIVSGNLIEEIYKVFCTQRLHLLRTFTDILKNLCEKNNSDETTLRLAASVRQFCSHSARYEYLIETSTCDKSEVCFIEEYFETFLYRATDADIYLGQFYSDIAEATVSAMVECYSDCTAIELTGISAEDFLLSFIYEVWDIDQAFPDNLNNCLRMGTDLKVMYGIEGSLGNHLEEKIRDKVKKKQEDGYVYKHINEMIDRMNFLLEQYKCEKFNGIAEQAAQYIKKIQMHWQGNPYPELRELYRKCAFDDCSPDGQVYSSIRAMLSEWKELGKVK